MALALLAVWVGDAPLPRDSGFHLHAVALPGGRQTSYGFGVPEASPVSL